MIVHTDGDFVALDGDGSIVVDVEDDLPELKTGDDITPVGDLQVDEDALTPEGNTDGNAPDPENASVLISYTALGGLVSFGADQPGGFSLNDDITGDTVEDAGGNPVTSDEAPVTYYLHADGTPTTYYFSLLDI